MWMLESMNITHSVTLQSICVPEKHFFIDRFWTLLACIGLVNQYRNGPNEICASSLFIPFSFYSFPFLSSCASFSVDSPHPHLSFSFHFFSYHVSKLVIGLFICWSCLCFFSCPLDLMALKISFSCSCLASSDTCFLSLEFLWSFTF